MRIQLIISTAVAVASLLGAAPILQAEVESESMVTSATLAVKKLSVNGMTCFRCVQAVEAALKKVEGVSAVEVSLEGNEAIVEYDSLRVDPQMLIAVVIETGFEAALQEKEAAGELKVTP